MNKIFYINTNYVHEATLHPGITAGNIGNAYIGYALGMHTGQMPDYGNSLPNVYALHMDFMDAEASAKNISDRYDIAVGSLQDQIRISESYGLKLPYERIIRLLSLLTIPVVVTSIGVNNLEGYTKGFHKELPEDTKQFARDLCGIATKIGVRGEYSFEVLRKIGCPADKMHVIGCSSFFINGPALGEIIHKQYLECTGISGEGLLCQDGRWSMESMDEWESAVRKYDFILGTRLHGAIVAINNGVPAAVCNQDSRSREMCELFGIPYFPEHHLNYRDKCIEIFDKCDYTDLNKRYNGLFENYSNFMEGICH